MSLPLLLAVLLAGLLVAPERAEIDLRAGEGPALVGRPLLLTLDIPSLEDARIEFPAEGAEFGTFLFLQGERDGDEVTCALMPTISGTQTISTMPLVVRRGHAAPALMSTRPLRIAVGTALPQGQEPLLLDDLPLERFSGWSLAYLWWLLLPALFVLLGLLRRREKSRAPARRRGPISITPFDPEAAALAELSVLLERELAPGAPARLLLADLSDALRRYLSARVERMSMFRTLEEFEPLLLDLEGDQESDLPRALFRDAELAKFSGLAPVPADVKRLLNRSVLFVRSRVNGRAGRAAG